MQCVNACFHFSPVNIYKQGSIADAEKCLPIVEAITARVNELLLQWPENHILVEVKNKLFCPP